jgi:hypothetical protein
VILPPSFHKNTPVRVQLITLPGNNGKPSLFLPPQRCVAARMRPELDASSYLLCQRCVAARMRPELDASSYLLPAMRRCRMRPELDASSYLSDASLPGCVRKLDASSQRRCVAARMRPELDASSYLLSQRCVAARMRPELDASSYLLSQRCVAAGCVRNWMRPVNGDASLPGCVRNWMRPVISSASDASLPGCVRNWMRPVISSPSDASLPDASGTGCVQSTAMRRCPDASSNWTSDASLHRMHPIAGCAQSTFFQRCVVGPSVLGQVMPRGRGLKTAGTAALNAPGRWTWL